MALNNDSYPDIHTAPFFKSYPPYYLDVYNYLSEYKTEADKAKVRANLGISDAYTNTWGSISGSIESQSDLYEIISNLKDADSSNLTSISSIKEALTAAGITVDETPSLSLTGLSERITLLEAWKGTTTIPTQASIEKTVEDYVSTTCYNKTQVDALIAAIERGDGSYTEIDPVFVASAAHGISATDISNWNAVYTAYSNGTIGGGMTTDLVTQLSEAYAAKHTHSNQSTLDAITDTRVTSWDTAASLTTTISVGVVLLDSEDDYPETPLTNTLYLIAEEESTEEESTEEE